LLGQRLDSLQIAFFRSLFGFLVILPLVLWGKGHHAFRTTHPYGHFLRGAVGVAIAPGLFATPMLQGRALNIRDSLARSIPFPNRLGQPGEYAALVLHLCRNVMINGEVIRLDGALRMAPR
jgi:hypothetical protein